MGKKTTLKPDVTPRRTKKYLIEIDKYILYKLIKGDSHFQIIEYLVDNEGMTEANARFRLDQVMKRISKSDDLEFEEKISKYKEMYSNLYRESLKNDNYRVAKEILDSMTKLEGLLTQKIEAKIDNTYTIKFE